jgi:hypothetical protein
MKISKKDSRAKTMEVTWTRKCTIHDAGMHPGKKLGNKSRRRERWFVQDLGRHTFRLTGRF